MTDPAITPKLVKEHGLTPEEYERIREILGREPNYTELGIFSVMWSEHCSYKSTRPLLQTFPTRSQKVLVGAGEENAGIIDTGVGGMSRGALRGGARPVAASSPRQSRTLTHKGLSHPSVRPTRGR